MDETQEPRTLPAVRLIFEYEGDEVRLVSKQPVDVAVPGFDIALVPHPGDYVETRNAADEPLSRVPVREAFSTSAEVFPEQPGEPITRIDLPERRGAFTVIVPAGSEATHVALLQVRAPEGDVPQAGPGATTAKPGAPVIVEVAKFELATSPASEGGR